MNRTQIIIASLGGVALLVGGFILVRRNKAASAWEKLSDEEKNVQMDYWRDGLAGWERNIRRWRTEKQPGKLSDWYIEGQESNPEFNELMSARKIRSDAHYQAKKQGKYIPVGHEVRRTSSGEYELQRIPGIF